jgi:flagellar assembly protein FliH
MTTGVIKSAEAQRRGMSLAPLDLRDVQHEADAILSAARREAEDIRRRAEAEAAEFVAQARQRLIGAMALAKQRGHEDGIKRGLAAGEEKGRAEALEAARGAFATASTGAVSALASLASSWKDAHRMLFHDARQDVLAMAIAVARRVAPRLPEIDPGVAADACGAALAMIGAAHSLTIRLHPDDLDAVKTLLDERIAGLGDAAHVRWMADPAVEPGGARIENPRAAVDARMSTQLNRISDELLGSWRERLAAMTGGQTADAAVESIVEPSQADAGPATESSPDGNPS